MPSGQAGKHIVPIEIRAENLHKSFGVREVLRGISLEIRSGEVVAIVGASGSGKTVFLDHLIGLLEPTSGRVFVADHDRPEGPLVALDELDEEHLDRIRLHWSVVFQKNALFTGTVYDNLALWLREHTELAEEEIRRRAIDSLRAVDLDEKDVLGKQRDALSGGMAKRVAIARAIATEPLVLFYDEPTTGLDPVISGRIHELIWDLHHRRIETASHTARTSVIVTHDKELLRRLRPRVVMLDAGQVCFDGPYDDFQVSEVPAAKEYLAAMPVLHAHRPRDVE